jgi:hypothetical protein
MSILSRSFVALAFTTVAACATGHQAMSGSVVMKVSDTEAHVCLFEQDAPIGARVQLYRHKCVSQAGKRYDCDKQPVAVGTIAHKMGHYAMVTFPQGTQYEEGNTVEQIQ